MDRGAVGLAWERKTLTGGTDARHLDLATKLRTMLELAPVGSTSTIHHLFGIVCASQLRGMKLYELERIAASAGSRASMGREISKRCSLSRFVDVKSEYATWP